MQAPRPRKTKSAPPNWWLDDAQVLARAINTICSLGFENRYSAMDNYAEFLSGGADQR